MSNFKYQISKKNTLLFLSILLLAVSLRLPLLNTLPPGNDALFWWRLLSSIAGAVSVGLLYLIVFQQTRKANLAFVTALALCFMPWHIEQSRIISEATLGLTVVLTAALLWTVAPCKRCKLFIIFTASIVLYRVYPSFWLFHFPYHLPTLYEYIHNLVRLASVEFLFYKNDSFWLGGFRTVGVLLPSTLLLLLVGIINVIRTMKFRQVRWLGGVVAVWFIAAATPLYPEGREFFFITPFLALLVGLGMQNIFQFGQKSKYKLLIVGMYGLIIMYEYIVFGHYYVVHYSGRIAHEIPYAQIKF